MTIPDREATVWIEQVDKELPVGPINYHVEGCHGTGRVHSYHNVFARIPAGGGELFVCDGQLAIVTTTERRARVANRRERCKPGMHRD